MKKKKRSRRRNESCSSNILSFCLFEMRAKVPVVGVRRALHSRKEKG